MKIGTSEAEEYMKNRNYSKAKILVLIPIIIVVITVICMILAAILAIPTNKGVLYSLFALAGLLGMILTPLPCLVMAVAGTVFAAKAAKEGIVQSRIFLVLGIIEILINVSGVFLAIAMFVAGQGV